MKYTPHFRCRWLLTLSIAFFLAPLGEPIHAQQLPPAPPPRMPKSLPMQSQLYDAQQLATSRDWTSADLELELRQRGLTLTDDGMVHVTISGPPDRPAIPARVVESVGGRDDVSALYQRDAWVPVDALIDLAGVLPAGYFLARVESGEPTEVIGEGPVAINSAGYRDGGADGSGLTIAIIDHGFDGLSEAWANGDIPSPYTYLNYTPNPLESVTVHGTGCLEAAYDHAPGAEYRLYMVDAVNDLLLVVDDAFTNGVDVISISLTYWNTGWHDNEGLACQMMDLAAANGITVFVSAGNYGLCHWQGNFNPGAGSGDWHDFHSSGDETVNILVRNGERVRFLLQWNTDGGTYDYELFLFDNAMNVIAGSTNPDNYYESITWTNNTGTDQIVHLAVERFSGGITELEVFTHYGEWQEHHMAWSSTGSPSNTTHPNVISVGAVEWDDFTLPGGTYGIVTDYSSRGPSNSGMLLPDLCGPTNCHTFVYPDGMGGTSNSTPNCAGAFAAFRSADLLLHVDGARWLTFQQAMVWRDWGDYGGDYDYGLGGMILYDFAPNTLWVARSYGNETNSRAYPFFTVQAAHDAATIGGRLLLFPGGGYPEPASLSKALTVETTEYMATLGQ